MDIDEHRAALDDEILNLRIRDFIKRYAPANRDFKLDFEVDFIRIVRLAYSEAAKPYQRQMTAMIAAMPPPGMFFSASEKPK
jgi:hypothetical protein